MSVCAPMCETLLQIKKKKVEEVIDCISQEKYTQDLKLSVYSTFGPLLGKILVTFFEIGDGLKLFSCLVSGIYL